MSDDFTGVPPAPTPPPAPPMTPAGGDGPVSDTSKILAALGYVVWVIALIAILIEPYKNEKFVRLHAIQGLALGVAIWVVSAVTSAIFIGFFIGIAGFIYQIILAVKVWNGESFEVPVVYGIVKQYI
ncbi:MAG: hypothetical protein U1F44_02315 [Coriobacteriia bacterium]|nr:hypothetical protein [Coriobacteriia bacterium]